jgi:hypothetical protein
LLMSTPLRNLWAWGTVNGPLTSSIVVGIGAMLSAAFYLGRIHSDLANDLAQERQLREQQVTKERQLREQQVTMERELREQQFTKERQLREEQVTKERELRQTEVTKERQLRQTEVTKERELRQTEVKALHSQLKMQQQNTKQMIDDAVQSKLFVIQNTQEYAGHPISRHPAPDSG